MNHAVITTRDDTRAIFFAAMAELQEHFTTAEADIAERETALKTAFDAVQTSMTTGLGDTVLADGHRLSRLAEDFNAELLARWTSWRERVEAYDRQTRFRHNLTDSLVVFVLGKVKAGKSSLGNYIAHGTSTPQATNRSSMAEFFTSSEGGNPDDDAGLVQGKGGHFAVGVSETTRTIQGFRLPGLTWVDAPGLGSMIRENGTLTKQYVDAADIIIYPTSSSSPGRNDDIREISDQLEAGKRLLVLITQADKYENDVDENGAVIRELTMKSETELIGQVEWVRGEVAKAKPELAPDIIPVSVRYAEIHNNESWAFEKSGLADFFRLLTEIAHSEGVQLKCKAPSRNLNLFVRRVLQGDGAFALPPLAMLHESLEGFRATLKETEGSLRDRSSAVAIRVVQRLPQAVDEQIARHADDKNSEGFVAGCEYALRGLLREEILREMKALLKQRDQVLFKLPDVEAILDITTFEDETIIVPRSNRGAAGAAGNGVGGLLGLLAGASFGPIGLFVGPLIGGWLGGQIGTAAGSDWEEKVKSGDNRERVNASAREALRNAAMKAVDAFFAMLINVAVKAPEERLDRLGAALKTFETTLKTKVHSHG